MTSGIAFRCDKCRRYVTEEACRAAYEAGDRTSRCCYVEPYTECDGEIRCCKPPAEERIAVPEPTDEQLHTMFVMLHFFSERYVN